MLQPIHKSSFRKKGFFRRPFWQWKKVLDISLISANQRHDFLLFLCLCWLQKSILRRSETSYLARASCSLWKISSHCNISFSHLLWEHLYRFLSEWLSSSIQWGATISSRIQFSLYSVLISQIGSLSCNTPDSSLLMYQFFTAARKE